jgi:RHS repeat-associated protein
LALAIPAGRAGLSLDQVFSRTPASGTASYLLTDALGSTVGLADTSGVVGTSYTYEPFGKTTVSGAANTNPFAFTGRENDSTGSLALYNYRTRSYSPALQRFLTEDPIAFAGQDVNLYAYTRNRPTTDSDATGLILSTFLNFMSGFAQGFRTAFGYTELAVLVLSAVLFLSGVVFLNPTLVLAAAWVGGIGTVAAFTAGLAWGTWQGVQSVRQGWATPSPPPPTPSVSPQTTPSPAGTGPSVSPSFIGENCSLVPGRLCPL